MTREQPKFYMRFTCIDERSRNTVYEYGSKTKLSEDGMNKYLDNKLSKEASYLIKEIFSQEMLGINTNRLKRELKDACHKINGGWKIYANVESNEGKLNVNYSKNKLKFNKKLKKGNVDNLMKKVTEDLCDITFSLPEMADALPIEKQRKEAREIIQHVFA